MSQENVWLDKLDKCLKKSIKTIATDAEEISEELDVSIFYIHIFFFFNENVCIVMIIFL